MRVYKQVYELLYNSGFWLTKWNSNSRAVLNKSEWFNDMKDASLEDDELLAEWALGLQWNAEIKKFTFKICQIEKPLTGR